MPPHILITSGPHRLLGVLEPTAPKTSALFLSLLPYAQRLIHVRWSGEAMWIPLGDTNFDLPYENHTSHAYPGQLLLYPGGISETEFLFPYGGTLFASKHGVMSANHFLTVVAGLEELRPLGVKTLWEGAQSVEFRIATEEEVKSFGIDKAKL